MKFLYSTDLHGFEWKYDYILDYAIKNDVPIVLNGGDLLPEGYDLYQEQSRFIDNYLFDHFNEYEKNQIYYLFILGNDDLKIFDEQVNDYIFNKPYLKNLAKESVNINDIRFHGFDLVLDAPFFVKDRFRRDLADKEQEPKTLKGYISTKEGFIELDWVQEFYSKLSLEEELTKIIVNPENRYEIMVIHQPPYGCNLANVESRKDVGSKAVRKFIETKKPWITLHGHIHESFKVTGNWKANLGNTLCLQPGQDDDLIFIEGDLKTKNLERKIVPHIKYFYVNKS